MQFLQWWRGNNNNNNNRDLSSEARRILRALNELADERDMLNQQLTHAIDTIKTLQDQLAEHDFLLKQAQIKLTRQKMSTTSEADSRETPRSHRTSSSNSNSNSRSTRTRTSTIASTSTAPTSVTASTSSTSTRGRGPTWIQNTWLCTQQNSRLLGAAECEWKHGNPQRAINALSAQLTTRKDLLLSERLKCQLLMAAIFHCHGQHDESNQLLNVVLEKTQGSLIPNYSHTMELAGIAHFIQGKNMVALENWNEAFWSLTKALYTPGYHDKAQQLQDSAMRTLESTTVNNETWMPTIRTLARPFGC